MLFTGNSWNNNKATNKTIDKQMIQAFVITSPVEVSRKKNIELLAQQLPGLRLSDAVYPRHEKVPFIEQLVSKSKERGGRALNYGEIGVILSNRRVWREVLRMAQTDEQHFLVLESDSHINDPVLLHKHAASLTSGHDLFFFGGWLGHMKLNRSTRKHIEAGYFAGEPFVKTICSAYGYSVNRKAAKYLLECTGKMAYPVDEFKKYMQPGVLRIGAVVPELITQKEGEESTIGHNGMKPVIEKIWLFLLDVRNTIICYFK